MFSDKDFSGKRIDRAYAEARIRWEPIIEVTQIKGDGETHPLLSTDDEFADFENWDVTNLAGSAPKGRLDAAVRVRAIGTQTGLEAR